MLAIIFSIFTIPSYIININGTSSGYLHYLLLKTAKYGLMYCREMNLEIEAKAYVKNAEKVKTILLKMGAHHEATYHQTDYYFDHPSRSFAQTDEAVRIRLSNNDAFLTYKGPKIDTLTKTREELEIRIQDPEISYTMLERLGFQFIAQVTKKREVYIYEDLHICVDEVDGLGHFVEVEIQKGDMETGRSKILAFLHRLKVDELENRSYLELLLEKNE
jgi:adenylate cyclase class 2